MQWEAQRTGRGYLAMESRLRDGEGARKANDLLCGMVGGFVKRNAQFYEELREFPFTYGELQTLPILFASALDAGALPFAEHPLSRRKHAGTCRLDLWILHRDVVFLLEVKHLMLSSRRRASTEVEQCWTRAVQQVRGPKPSSTKELLSKGSSIAFRVAVLVAPIYQQSSDRDEIEPIDRDRMMLFERELRDDLYPAPNWAGIWAIPDRWQKPVTFDEGDSWESYACVVFEVRLEPVHR